MKIRYALIAILAALFAGTAWAAQPMGEGGKEKPKSEAREGVDKSTPAPEAKARILAIDKEIVFRDAADKEIKRIKAGKHNGPAYGEERQVRKKDKTGKERTIREQILRNAAVSKSQRVVFVNERIVGFAVPKSTKEAKAWVGTDSAAMGVNSTLELYDEQGELRWRKPLRDGNEVFSSRMSDDGEAISLVEGCNMECPKLAQPEVPRQRLVVWNSEGNELVTFPRKRDDCVVGTLGHWISPDGAYTITSCSRQGEPPRSILVDVKNGRIWRANKLMHGLRVKDNQTIEVLTTDDKEKQATEDLNLGSLTWESTR